jgi:hypothetical protein
MVCILVMVLLCKSGIYKGLCINFVSFLFFKCFFLISNESFIEGQPMYTRCKHKDCQKIRKNNDQSDPSWN